MRQMRLPLVSVSAMADEGAQFNKEDAMQLTLGEGGAICRESR